MVTENIVRGQTEFDERSMNLAAERERKLSETHELITEGKVCSLDTISNLSIERYKWIAFRWWEMEV
jgi:hypothetical protein